MNSSDGKSAAPPLRKRKSKRFDRSGSNQRLGGSSASAAKSAPGADDAVDGDAESTDEVATAGLDVKGDESQPVGETVASPEADKESGDSGVKNDIGAAADAVTAKPFVPVGQRPPSTQAGSPSSNVVTDGTVRGKPLDERQACGRCGHELSLVNIEVDGNVLIMESCDNCDSRRWQLAGEPIDLQQVLDHVGEHAGRRR